MPYYLYAYKALHTRQVSTLLSLYEILSFYIFTWITFYTLFYSLRQQKMAPMTTLEVEIPRAMCWKGLSFRFTMHNVTNVILLVFITCLYFLLLAWFCFLILSLLAKLDKADRALCFTSGMAALAAVAHLVGTGAFFHHFYLFILTCACTIICF